MFGIVNSLTFILSFMLYLTGKPDEFCCYNFKVLEILEEGNDTKIEKINVAQNGNNYYYIFCWLIICIIISISYIIMFICAKEMSKYVRTRLKVDTDRFYEINKQLTFNIIIYV
ncbi:hypothetical protein Mgra_00001560, partial [Meloidogyne graminicola]